MFNFVLLQLEQAFAVEENATEPWVPMAPSHAAEIHADISYCSGGIVRGAIYHHGHRMVRNLHR